MVGSIEENKMTGHELIAAIVTHMYDLNKEITCHVVQRESVGNSVVRNTEFPFRFCNGKIYVENPERVTVTYPHETRAT